MRDGGAKEARLLTFRPSLALLCLASSSLEQGKTDIIYAPTLNVKCWIDVLTVNKSINDSTSCTARSFLHKASVKKVFKQRSTDKERDAPPPISTERILVDDDASSALTSASAPRCATKRPHELSCVMRLR